MQVIISSIVIIVICPTRLGELAKAKTVKEAKETRWRFYVFLARGGLSYGSYEELTRLAETRLAQNRLSYLNIVRVTLI